MHRRKILHYPRGCPAIYAEFAPSNSMSSSSLSSSYSQCRYPPFLLLIFPPNDTARCVYVAQQRDSAFSQIASGAQTPSFLLSRLFSSRQNPYLIISSALFFPYRSVCALPIHTCTFAWVWRMCVCVHRRRSNNNLGRQGLRLSLSRTCARAYSRFTLQTAAHPTTRRVISGRRVNAPCRGRERESI